MFSESIINELKPEIVHLMGHTIVPSKALSYKKNDRTGKIIEKISPKTHKFEESLRRDLKKELLGISLFPTKKEVFVAISYGINSKKEYNTYDLDNKAKTILDAFKKVVYLDDSQVKILWTHKEFLKNTQESYCLISVKILNKNKAKRLISATAQLQKI